MFSVSSYSNAVGALAKFYENRNAHLYVTTIVFYIDIMLLLKVKHGILHVELNQVEFVYILYVFIYYLVFMIMLGFSKFIRNIYLYHFGKVSDNFKIDDRGQTQKYYSYQEMLDKSFQENNTVAYNIYKTEIENMKSTEAATNISFLCTFLMLIDLIFSDGVIRSLAKTMLIGGDVFQLVVSVCLVLYLWIIVYIWFDRTVCRECYEKSSIKKEDTLSKIS